MLADDRRIGQAVCYTVSRNPARNLRNGCLDKYRPDD
jgi:hypothetical protein